MLIFPDDQKAMLRKTVGDPRIFFLTFLILDTLSYAVLLLYLAHSSGILTANGQVFVRLIINLLTASEARALANEVIDVLAGEGTSANRSVLATVASVT